MDEIVIRAIARWPDVPSVYGWLRLDRRGQWQVKSRATREGAPVFERISNPAVVEFIGRNYERDGKGRWFFQNGPQRVFVTLDYTPWVFRLDDKGEALVAQHGRAPTRIERAFLDEKGAMVLDTDLGPGVLSDRDLAAVLERLTDPDGGPLDAETLAADVEAGREREARLLGVRVLVQPLRSPEAPQRFGYDADPRPAPGEPDC